MRDQDNGGIGDDDTNNQSGTEDTAAEENSHNDADVEAQGDDEGNDAQDEKEGRRNNPDGDDEGDDTNDDDVEPPTRKSKLQYIKERQERARQKREKEQLENQRQKKSNSEEEGDDEDYDSLPDNERKLYDRFERMFMKKHGGSLEKAGKAVEIAEENETNADITDFLKNDEYGDLIAKHEAKLRRYAMHPSRRQVPIEELMYGIAGRELIAFGAELARKAAKEAKKSKNGGTSNRKVEGRQEKPISEMSDAEVAAIQKDVLRGRK